MKTVPTCILLIVATVARTAWSQTPGGLIAYPGMEVVVDGEGVQSPNYRFDNHCAKPTPWQAHWISGGHFRKEVTLDATPTKASAWIMADKSTSSRTTGAE